MAENPNLPSEHHDSPEGTAWIWKVFWILLVVTAVEVILGIIKPGFLLFELFGTSFLNLLFIALTIVKAYYIVAEFMHVKFERANLVWTLALPVVILIPYLAFVLLTDGSYMNILLE